MGALGGLFGLKGGASGSGFGTNPGVDPSQINDAYTGVQKSLGNQDALLAAIQGQGGLQKQNDVYGQLQGVASGQGPNPAQAMLSQATGANVANQAALAAGQRGAGANVGLIARQAAQTGANLQQQAAGQGATMQAQQSLNAIGQAGGMASGMANNQIGQTNANQAAHQAEQSALLNANAAHNTNQTSMANTTMAGQQGMIGGIMNGAGAAFGLAEGGEVPSAYTPQSMFGQGLATQSAPMAAADVNGNKSGAEALQKGVSGGMGGKKKDPMAAANGNLPAATNTFNSSMAGPAMMMPAALSSGGKVPAMVSPGERVLNPSEAQAVARGKVNPMKVGGQVPGQAKVKGDSYQNDTIPAKLPAGGVVIPRSVMQSKDPVRGAAEFVRAAIAKKKASA